MMWVAVWCAAVLASSAAAPAQGGLSVPTLDLSQIDNAAPDDEGISYGTLPQLGARYESNDPWVYLLADMPHESQFGTKRSLGPRPRRAHSVLSVNPAVEHLQSMALSAHNERLAHRNRNFLNCIGKRDPWSTSDCMQMTAN